jgi:hypothetical protein
MGKRGRPAINIRAMTNAERARRHREKQRAVRMAAQFEDWSRFWKSFGSQQTLAFTAYSDDLTIRINGTNTAISLTAREARSLEIVDPGKCGSQ